MAIRAGPAAEQGALASERVAPAESVLALDGQHVRPRPVQELGLWDRF